MQRVLVVDDDRLVADTLALVFGKSGFDARAAYSADQAMSFAREFKPHLLLCDVTMLAETASPFCLTSRTSSRPAASSCSPAFTPTQDVRDHASSSPARRHPHQTCQPAELLREAAALLATA